MNKHMFLASIVLHALLLMTAYLLQGVVFPYIRVFGLVPVLLPLVSTGAAVFEGRGGGGVVGLFAGILLDISLNQPVAVFAVILAVAGIVFGFTTETVMARGFPTYFVCCAATLIITAFAQMFSLLFFDKVPAAELLAVAAYQTLYSLLFTLPLYFIVRKLGRITQNAKNPA